MYGLCSCTCVAAYVRVGTDLRIATFCGASFSIVTGFSRSWREADIDRSARANPQALQRNLIRWPQCTATAMII